MQEDKKKAFEQKMISILNHGALNLAMGIGYRAGLFDAMARLDSHVPVSDIAKAAGLSERYVREWLGIMATAGVVSVLKENGQNQYHLPPEHGACLARQSGDGNLGVYTQEIPILTQSALSAVENGFATGQGVDFSRYPDFQSFMGELSDAKHEKTLISVFLPGVDQGRVVEQLKTGIRVCDLGCGEGVALNLMAAAFPQSVFTGIDTHEQAIVHAGRQAEARGLSNVRFCVRDAAGLAGDPEFKGCFDYITAFDAIHDQSHPQAALKGVVHMLSPGGAFSMVDIDAGSDILDNLDHPMGPFLYTVSLMHCMPVGLTDQGAGLGMMWGRKKAVSMMADAGFQRVDVCEMAHDPFNIHYFARKG